MGNGEKPGDPDAREASPDAAPVVRSLRRRWTSGVAVGLVGDGAGGFRGIALTSFMVVSEEPPLVALAVRIDGEFATFLADGDAMTVSVLEAAHEFLADRFSGRAPLPDRALTGINHQIDDGLPVIAGALAWCRGSVVDIRPAGDHLLVIVAVAHGEIGPDTDDPLLRYEGRYRRLEAG